MYPGEPTRRLVSSAQHRMHHEGLPWVFLFCWNLNQTSDPAPLHQFHGKLGQSRREQDGHLKLQQVWPVPGKLSHLWNRWDTELVDIQTDNGSGLSPNGDSNCVRMSPVFGVHEHCLLSLVNPIIAIICSQEALPIRKKLRQYSLAANPPSCVRKCKVVNSVNPPYFPNPASSGPHLFAAAGSRVSRRGAGFASPPNDSRH